MWWKIGSSAFWVESERGAEADEWVAKIIEGEVIAVGLFNLSIKTQGGEIVTRKKSAVARYKWDIWVAIGASSMLDDRPRFI